MSLVLFRHCETAMEAAGIRLMIQRAGIPGTGTFVQSAEVFVEQSQLEQVRRVLDGEAE